MMKSRDRGKVLLNTYLQKRSKVLHMWNPRFCVLTEKFLITYKEKGDGSTSSKSINLDECIGVKNSDKALNKDYTFELIQKDRSHFFVCNDRITQDEWIKTIKKVISDLHKNTEDKKDLKES